MLKKLFIRLGRLALLYMAICGQLTMIFVIVEFAYELSPAIHATSWHLRHGNTVAFDGHIFHLPHSWYPDPDSHPGELELRHTHLGSMDISTIHLSTSPHAVDDRSLQELYAKQADHLNEHSTIPDEWKPETLSGRKLTFYCMASSLQGMIDTLTCQAANSNLQLVTLTAGRARTDALNIIETSE